MVGETPLRPAKYVQFMECQDRYCDGRLLWLHKYAMPRLGHLLILFSTLAVFHGKSIPWVQNRILNLPLQPLTRRMNVGKSTAPILYNPHILAVDLSHLKALGKPEGLLPNDVWIFPSTHLLYANILQMIIEALLALVLGIVGASLNAAPLKEITWASEMRTRHVVHYPFLNGCALRKVWMGQVH
jgi:hypothetical protein